ncbi:T9SS type A sorting domain-containing protein [Winogradskyella jejuensis]|uniref:Por secretion system C-terminal sorting domain-containing protein n=1 Tax=Winogradskyella jejuensis TaxID=1089305 RepID=A0A1M5TPM2_9FLAO|nr:T9SS type A sorting domain-containing protein [Winogradskyella jejuensis]SHH52620.1 Por secretion system C-terminal sorting domain-containing protein [Winogradskyella jejuensis]
MKKKIIGFGIVLLFGFCGYAQETFKVMFYNLLNYPLENTLPNREDNLEFILGSYQPDLLLVCELNNETGANSVLSIAQNIISSDYESATFVSNTSDFEPPGADGLHGLFYYNKTKLSITDEVIVQTNIRDFNVYKILFNTVDKASNPIEAYIIVGHLKASDSPEDAQKRLLMVEELDDYLSTIPANSNVIFGGDLNLYRASEPAFQLLVDTSNNIPFVDPVNRVGEWSDTGSQFVDVFTQSTRTTFGLGGAAGGFDDRFDFLLSSTNLLNSSNNLRYVTNSYEAYGNNKETDCFNRAINSIDCAEGADSGNPDNNTGYTFNLREALHNFSDHLPVVMEVEIDDQLLSTEVVNATEIKILEKNIVKYQLVLKLSSPLLRNKTFSIYNAIGQQIIAKRTNTNLQETIDVSSLSNGIYYLRFSDTNINPVKFIIAR